MLCLGDSACNLTRREQKWMHYAQATVGSKCYKDSMLTAGEMGKATACKVYNNKRSCVETPQGTVWQLIPSTDIIQIHSFTHPGRDRRNHQE